MNSCKRNSLVKIFKTEKILLYLGHLYIQMPTQRGFCESTSMKTPIFYANVKIFFKHFIRQNS